MWREVQKDIAGNDLQFLESLRAKMLLHNAAQFERRVTGTLRQYPFKLLWLVLRPADQHCHVRSHIAKEILQTDQDKLEVNTRKIVSLFRDPLQIASQTGLLPSQQLYWMLWASSLLWKSDVRTNEGLNKYLSLLDDRAPNTSVDLSRVPAYLCGTCLANMVTVTAGVNQDVNGHSSSLWQRKLERNV